MSKRLNKAKIKFVMPQMSWERPIEEAILDFVQSMAIQMEQQIEKRQDKFLWFDLDKDIREGAEHYANAYRTVEKHILGEIRIRERISTMRGGEK